MTSPAMKINLEPPAEPPAPRIGRVSADDPRICGECGQGMASHHVEIARGMRRPICPTPSALPHQMSDADILAEHAASELRMIDDAVPQLQIVRCTVERCACGGYSTLVDNRQAEACECGCPRCDNPLATPIARETPAPKLANLSFNQVVNALRDADRCATCGKTRAVMNVAGRHQRFRAERVTAETHCTCVGGPAYGMAPAPTPPAPIDLTEFVVKMFDGAIGDHPLPFATLDAACAAVEAQLAARAGRALRQSEIVKIGIAVVLEYNKRRNAVEQAGGR